MLTEELKKLIPVTDPAARWCQGKGKASVLATFGRRWGGKFTPHESIEHSGGAIRLCAACGEAFRVQAEAAGFHVHITQFAETSLTPTHT